MNMRAACNVHTNMSTLVDMFVVCTLRVALMFIIEKIQLQVFFIRFFRHDWSQQWYKGSQKVYKLCMYMKTAKLSYFQSM